ncbi:MAG: hypothetical protein AAGG01_06465 [Planctomycetota bacterium]
MAAAALTAVILNLPENGAGAPRQLESEWRDFRPPESSDSRTLVAVMETLTLGAAPDWSQSFRGAEDARTAPLLNYLAILHVDDLFGCATLLDSDGWLVASSDLVAHAIQKAALGAPPASVEVQLLEATTSDPIETRPRGPRRSAVVVRHVPDLGLSLLRLTDTAGLSQPALTLAESLPEPSSEALLAAASAADGAFVARKRFTRTTAPTPRFLRLTERNFVSGMQGSPLFGPNNPEQLLGVLLPPEGSTRLRVAPATSIRTLLESKGEQPASYPIDPFLAPVGSSRWATSLGQKTDGGPFAMLVTTESPGGESTQLLLLSESRLSAETLPTSSFLSPRSPDPFRYDVFLARYPDGTVAMGRAGDDGRLETVVAQPPGEGAPAYRWTAQPGSASWTRSEHPEVAAETLLGLDDAYRRSIEATTQAASNR